jgi:glutamyl-tRNA synthetase
MDYEDIKELARKFAIRNAFDYGKADEKAVLGKVLGKYKENRMQLEKIKDIVKQAVADINNMNKNELEKAFEEFQEEFRAYDKEKIAKTAKPKMKLEGAEPGNFRTRFPPEPSGYMHIGHAKAAWLEREFADIYNGKIGLYFDDTNPEKEKQEYVDAFKKDLEWLGIVFDNEYYASDNIEVLYKYAEILIKMKGAYVCTCAAEKVKTLRSEGIGCEHKNESVEQALRKWNEMLAGKFDENEATLRFNGDMSDANTAIRDPVLFRIKKHVHYRQGNKYVVWPTYDFNTPIIDSVKGVTDAIRSKEYELRDDLYYKLLEMLGLNIPRIHSISRFEMSGNITSKRNINIMINEGKIEGYDDPRLVTIQGLRRRGILPKAIKEFVLRSGMSKAEGKVDMNTLLGYNRRLIDKIAMRLFAVENPVEVRIKNGKEKAKLKLYPDNESKFREYDIKDVVYLSKNDINKKELEDSGHIDVRLKNLYDIRIIKTDGIMNAERIYDTIPIKVLQWIPANDKVDCIFEYISDLINDDGELNNQSLKKTHVLAEAYVDKLKEGDIVQFERIGYFKLDNKKERIFISL